MGGTIMNIDVKKEEIAQKNDMLRRTFVGGKVILTAGVKNDPKIQQIINAVQQFNEFTEDNNPYLERDFGKVTIGDNDYFWKIDYYDQDYNFFQEDGHRVLTIMCADEY